MSEPKKNKATADLSKGVSAAGLDDGGMVLGHVGDKDVVLVRSGGELFAVGANCTHYRGPLAEGLVVGDTIRCPWHHACFSLRSGEALGAPALDPVAAYRVQIRDGLVFVVGKVEVPRPRKRQRGMGEPISVVIVGGGAAGSAAAETLRREGYTDAVTIIDPDLEAPYDRPNLSKDYLAGEAGEEWIPLRPPGFYHDQGIDRESGPATSIDIRNRTVFLASGRTLEFGALLLATG